MVQTKNDFYREYNHYAEYLDLNKGWTMTLDELMEFQKKLNTLNEKIKSIDIPEMNALIARGDKNSKILEVINNIAFTLSKVQMGMNSITSAVQNAYIIDAKYMNRIKNTETLSKFVGSCINAGIPPKYIGYNIYVASNAVIKGDGSHGDENNPIWGQSRVVLFPEDTSKIHKIALSGWGLRANKSEKLVSDKFKQVGDTSLIATVTSGTKNQVIIDAERVDTSKPVSDNDISKLRDAIVDFAQRHNIPLKLDEDLHEDNVAYRNGKPIAIDYGMAWRMSV